MKYDEIQIGKKYWCYWNLESNKMFTVIGKVEEDNIILVSDDLTSDTCYKYNPEKIVAHVLPRFYKKRKTVLYFIEKVANWIYDIICDILWI